MNRSQASIENICVEDTVFLEYLTVISQIVWTTKRSSLLFSVPIVHFSKFIFSKSWTVEVPFLPSIAKKGLSFIDLIELICQLLASYIFYV